MRSITSVIRPGTSRLIRICSVSALALLLAASFSACAKKADESGAGNASKDGNKTANSEGGGRWGAGAAEETVAVQVTSVTRGPIASTLSFNSTLDTESTVDLFPQISGQVDELLVEEGDFVKAGDALLKIDDRELRVDAEEAQVNLQREEANFTRIEELFKRGLVNQQEFENASFTLSQRRLATERTKIRFDHATIRAPSDGVVSEREVQVGARVGSGSKLFSLVSLHDMVALVYVPGRYLPDVDRDQSAVITSDFLPDQRFEAWVKRISPIIDPQSGTFKVTVGVRNPTRAILPGLFVKVAITTEERPNALLVPKRAVVYDGGSQFLFTVRDNKAVRVPLEAGFETPDTIEVRSGFNEGDPVIILGQAGLKDGASVKIVDPNAPPEAKPAMEKKRPETPPAGS